MLWDDNLRAESGQPAHGDNHDHHHHQRFRVNVVLLHAKTGVATGRELASPSSEVVTEQAEVDGGGGGGSVAAAFSYGGASAMDYAVPFLSAE